jgi:hypothetical protein
MPKSLELSMMMRKVNQDGYRKKRSGQTIRRHSAFWPESLKKLTGCIRRATAVPELEAGDSWLELPDFRYPMPEEAPVVFFSWQNSCIFIPTHTPTQAKLECSITFWFLADTTLSHGLLNMSAFVSFLNVCTGTLTTQIM